MKLPLSLHSRLILSHLLVSLISITLISLFAANSIFKAARDDIERSAEDLAYAAGSALEAPMSDFTSGAQDINAAKNVLMRLLANHPEIQYTIYLPDGTPIMDSGLALPPKADVVNAPEVWNAIRGDSGSSEEVRIGSQGEQVIYVAVRIQREAKTLAVVRLGTPLQPALVAARRSLALLVLVALLVAVGVSAFGWLLANNIVQPVQRVTQTAERLARGELSARVNPTGPQEIHRLAMAFNVMAGRLQDHVDELRSFVANASHELRTPLTVVKLRTEALRDGALSEPQVANQFLSEIESEVDRLSRMVNDLLDLSRMEAGLASGQRSLLNLEVLATEVYETFKIRAAKAGLDLELTIQPGLPSLSGNEDQLRRVLYNFIDNAIKYTPSGGRVDILLEPGLKGRTIRLLVKDSGPGIAKEHLSHIFERFYRVEATRPRYGNSRGSGLGLAICKSIVENHGGKIGVSSQLSKGSAFWVELPAHP
ncbi:MAG TPA: HAMP domain-containing sensor histidine kinase [Anaerolineales bacterium]